MLCYFAVVIVRLRSDCSWLEIVMRETIPRHRFMCDSIPSIFCHPDTLVVFGEDLVSLSKVAT
jgi:hypothetical protein